MKANRLRTLALITALLIGAGFALVFFWVPNEADQGFIQKIFYLHVPLAIVALVGFIIGGIHAIRHLRTGDPIHDARSYVSIHASVIFGVAVLLTGSIWAKASWGKWWVWDEPTLVSFLIVFLRLRDHGRGLRSPQLHGGPGGAVAGASAHLRHR
jgi:heme exporter protein C